jgi:hypothetical protein
MANLNWEKIHQQSRVQSTKEHERFENSHKQDYYIFLESGLWALKGKHYGKSVKSLPLSYLDWVIDNVSGIHKDIAEIELRRRYEKLSNT